MAEDVVVTSVTSQEVLDTLSDRDIKKIEKKACGLYLEAERSYVRFAAELRRLQDGSAHLTRGYSNFGDYAQATFEGLNPNTARQLSRQGQVLLVLESSGKISLDSGELLPKSHGVRALAVILNKYGDDVMLSIFDTALSYGRGITEDTVTAAVSSVLLPAAKPIEIEEESTDAIDMEKDDPEELYLDIMDRIDMVRDAVQVVSDFVQSDNLCRASLALDNDVQGEISILKEMIENGQ